MNELEQVLDDLRHKRIYPVSKAPTMITAKSRASLSYKKLLLDCLNGSGENHTEGAALANHFNTPHTFIETVREMNQILEPYKTCRAVSVALLAFDSNGNESTDPYLSEPGYLSLAFNENQAFILDLKKISLSTPLLSSLFKSKVLKVLYNAPDFLLFTRHLNIDTKAVSDVKVLEQLLRKGLGNLSPTLSETAFKYIGTNYDFPLLHKDGPVLTMHRVLATKVVLIHQLAGILYPLIRDVGMQKLATLEMQGTQAIVEMLYHGMPFDVSLFQQIKKQRHDEVQDVSQQLQSVLSYNLTSLFGNVARSVNLDSPPQVIKAFRRIGIDVPNTANSTLKPYAENYEEVKLFLEYRKKSYALHNTLSDNYLNYIHPITQRIHAHIEQNQATTGRILMSKPNLQGVAHGDPRRVFKASKDWVFVTGDYKQIDVVATAVIAQDQVMLEEIKNGEDIYIAAGRTFLQKEKISHEERKKFKPVVLGLIFNMSDYGLCNESKSIGSELSLNEAAAFRRIFFEKYQGIKKLHETLKEESLKVREVKSLMNRKRAFDNCLILVDKPVNLTNGELIKLINSALTAPVLKYNNGAAIKTSCRKEAEEYQDILTELDLSCTIVLDDPPLGEVYNGPAQMSVADLIKTAMYQMLPDCRKMNAEFVMTKHDDLTYHVLAENSETFAKALQIGMENASEKIFKGVKAAVEITIKNDFS